MVLLGLALAPVLAIILYFVFLDRFNKEPIKMLLMTFVFGVLSIIPAVLMEQYGMSVLGPTNSLVKDWIEAFIVIAFAEELAKYLFLRIFVFKSRHFDEPFDGIIYALMISMGFAGLENILYVIEGGVNVAIVRMFTAVPAHATFAVLMGYWVGRAKMENKPFLNWLGLFSAILFHGLYDFFLLADLFPGQILGALLSLIVAIILSRSAIKIHRSHILKAPVTHES
ncbi:PrsW family intramembrane metalloprotease [bacterium]|nr:PrsW family intramembrane metalloprotease [bacterium]